ncbi:hypothetical protein BGZ82_003543 [Podila clonocystis]|nr:hypothetical protein BGZ82_003543 [Podila clonocystis]
MKYEGASANEMIDTLDFFMEQEVMANQLEQKLIPKYGYTEEHIALLHVSKVIVQPHVTMGGSVSNCGCQDGLPCSCCRDRGGHIVVKPGKSPVNAGISKSYQLGTNPHRNGASDHLKSPMPYARDSSSPMSLAGYDPLSSPGASSGCGMNPGSSPLDFSPADSPDYDPQLYLDIQQGNSAGHPHLCFDYGGTPDHDPELCNPSGALAFFPESLPAFTGNGPLDMTYSTTTDEVQQLNTALSKVSTNSPGSTSNNLDSPIQAGSPAEQSLLQPVPKSCCKPAISISTTPSPAPSSTSCSDRSNTGVDESMAGTEGCGCAISANMCCCGEMCACPGCLAFPNNQPSSAASSTSLGPFSHSIISAIPEPVVVPPPKGGCCGSKRQGNSDNNTSALNLSDALGLIRSPFNSTLAMNMTESEARQQVVNAASAFASTDAAFKMQHPTLLGNDGVLICGCGCGRPTVDCSDCFRDMCKYVGETQARMMKEELELEMAMGRGGGIYRDLLGVNMNLSMAMATSTSSKREMEAQDMAMDMHMDSGLDGAYGYHILQQQLDNRLETNGGQGQALVQRLRDEEEQQRIRLQQMEQEQMRLSQLQPASMSQLSQLQLDFLDDEDWSFVDEIRTDGHTPSVVPGP